MASARLVAVATGVGLVAALSGIAHGGSAPAAQEPNTEIYSIGADGSGRMNLTRDPAPDGAPAVSPSGRRIAFWRTGPDGADIWLMAADGSRQRRFARPEADEYEPTWSPEGGRIAYTARPTGRCPMPPCPRQAISIFVMRLDGRVVYEAVGFSHPRFSPDGRRVLVTRSGSELWVLRLDGRGRRLLANMFPLGISGASWSPDGRRIAFVAQRIVRALGVRGRAAHSQGTYVVSVATGARRRIVNGVFPDLSWSPDGKLIAYACASRCPLWLVRPDGTGRRRLAPNGSVPSWSPDGRRIAYVQGFPRGQIRIVQLAGGRSHTVTRENPSFGYSFAPVAPVWMPDGRRLIYTCC